MLRKVIVITALLASPLGALALEVAPADSSSVQNNASYQLQGSASNNPQQPGGIPTDVGPASNGGALQPALTSAQVGNLLVGQTEGAHQLPDQTNYWPWIILAVVMAGLAAGSLWILMHPHVGTVTDPASTEGEKPEN